MKPRKTVGRSHLAPTFGNPFHCCALHVAVYRAPGPDEHAIEAESRRMITRHSTCRTHGSVGYVTLVESDFDRIWDGVNRGDGLGTAWAVLGLLGPGAEQFIDRVDDFVYGWMGMEDTPWGNLLLLQVFPRPHMLPVRN